MAPTIKDIAKRLNISVSTVSYALNGGPRSVPEEVKRKVLEVARELDYLPNQVARSLVTRRTRTIGVVPDRAVHDLILSPFLRALLNAILNELEDRGLDLLIFSGVEKEAREPSIDRLLDGRVDGMLFLSPLPDKEVLNVLARHGMCYVTIAAGEKEGRVDVSVDNRVGIRMAVEHLVELGHRRIGMVTGKPEHQDSLERESAFRECVQEFGLILDESWVECGDFTEKGYAAAQRILASPSGRPTALICANDESAVHAVQAIRDAGLSVPDDISITGFDDMGMATYRTPHLTTLRQPIEQMARHAVRLLLAMVHEEPVSSTRFEPTLMRRDSTSRPTRDQLP